MKAVAMWIVLVALWSGTAVAGTLGVDRDGDGLWDDLNEVVNQAPPFLFKVARNLALGLQEFTVAPAGNRSMAIQAIKSVQDNMLCLLSVGGPRVSSIPEELKGQIDRNPERSKRFRANEAAIAGENLPFDPDPSTWRQYCPADLTFPRPAKVLPPVRSVN